jgi:hypothetical protein
LTRQQKSKEAVALKQEALKPTIADRVSAGVPLVTVCRNLGLAVTTVRGWARSDEAFATELRQAHLDGYDTIAADVLEIADTPQFGEEVITGFDGDKVMQRTERREMIRHRQLRIRTRMELLAKWDPKRYGTLVQAQMSVDEGLAALMEKAIARAEMLDG